MMKFAVFLLSALAALLLHVASSAVIDAVAREEIFEMERIVGGSDAAVGQFPWTAALYKNGRFFCTSSIISPNIVMTAAHCVVSNGRTERAGIFHAIANLRRSSPTIRIDFASITPHPQYSESGFRNDIALFRTTQPIPFSDTVQPVCIARNDTDPMEYTNATAMGWGDTQRFRILPILPEKLQFVEQTVISNQRCRVFYGNELEDSKICAGELFSGICNGDSGGPLVHLSEDNEPVQIGVASYGSAVTGCGLLTPSVWTRVSSFNDFIKGMAEREEICTI